MADARVRTDIVFARPGTPSRRTWPLASSPTRRRSTSCSWPTMTLAISVRSLVIQAAAAWTCSLSGEFSLMQGGNVGQKRQSRKKKAGLRGEKEADQQPESELEGEET